MIIGEHKKVPSVLEAVPFAMSLQGRGFLLLYSVGPMPAASWLVWLMIAFCITTAGADLVLGRDERPVERWHARGETSKETSAAVETEMQF